MNETCCDQLLKPWARLCLNEGIGYAQAKNTLRKVLVQQAQQELLRRGTRVTVAALSLLTGMSQVAVRELMQMPVEAESKHPSALQQVMLEWSRGDWPSTLLYKGGGQSFTALVRSCQFTKASPRAVLREMKDRGLVLQADQYITRLAEVGGQHAADPATRTDLIGAVSDHAQAAINNLYKLGDSRLEQSLVCDGLTQASIEEVHALVASWWIEGSKQLYSHLKRLDENDARHGPHMHQRMRVGIYFYSEPLTHPQPPISSNTS